MLTERLQRALRVALLVGLSGSIAACDVSVAEDAAANEISIRDFSFSPVTLTVSAGTTVRWRNLDGEPHTIRSVDELFRSGPLDQDDVFSFRFDKPGTYRYVCSIHPQMTGTIVVK